MDREFRKILNDRSSGSAELCRNLMIYLRHKIINEHDISREIRLAKSKLGHFAVISNVLDGLILPLKKNEKSSVLDYIEEYLNQEQNVYEAVFKCVPRKLKKSDCVLTLSNSNTVFEVLKLWRSSCKNLKVFVLESLPGGEGKLLAGRLKKAGVNSVLVPDNSISAHIGKAGLLLLGCDAILRNGDVINKTGSRDAAVIAAYFNKPVLVVASEYKRIKSGRYSVRGRNKDEKYLFERIAKDLITNIITEMVS